MTSFMIEVKVISFKQNYLKTAFIYFLQSCYIFLSTLYTDEICNRLFNLDTLWTGYLIDRLPFLMMTLILLCARTENISFRVNWLHTLIVSDRCFFKLFTRTTVLNFFVFAVAVSDSSAFRILLLGTSISCILINENQLQDPVLVRRSCVYT